jgi:hypothetical protein
MKLLSRHVISHPPFHALSFEDISALGHISPDDLDSTA